MYAGICLNNTSDSRSSPNADGRLQLDSPGLVSLAPSATLEYEQSPPVKASVADRATAVTGCATAVTDAATAGCCSAPVAVADRVSSGVAGEGAAHSIHFRANVGLVTTSSQVTYCMAFRYIAVPAAAHKSPKNPQPLVRKTLVCPWPAS